MPLESLTDQLLMHIFEFLEWQAYTNLRQVCRKLEAVISHHETFWARECLRTYFSTDLDYISELYESPVYCQNLKSHYEKIQGDQWKKMLKAANAAKSQMRSVARYLASNSDATAFVNYFFEQLRNPSLPLAQLRPESIKCTTKTMFQDHLSGLLYEEPFDPQGMLYLGDEAAPVMEALTGDLQKYIKEIKQNGETKLLMEVRWYGQISTVLGRDISQTKLADVKLSKEFSNQSYDSCKSTLLGLYDVINNAIASYCFMVYEYLASFNNVYDLISEYLVRWTVYSYSMLQLNQSLAPFVNAMNQAYEQLFPDYPSFPKFSIWRLMVKNWMSIVFEHKNLSVNLNSSFLRIVCNHREKLLKEAIDSNFSALSQRLNTESFGEVPKTLYLSISTKKKKSLVPNSIVAKILENNPHPYFASSVEAEHKLLSNFLQTIVDLSLNEVTIHSIDCTDVNKIHYFSCIENLLDKIQSNHPYADFEEAFLESTSLFYQDQIKIFEESPNFFCRFLKSDISFVSEIITRRTSIKLEQIQVQQCLGFLRKSIFGIISCIQRDTLDQVEMTSDRLDSDCPLIREFVLAIISEQKPEIVNDSKLTEHKLLQKLVALIESKGHTDFQANLLFLDKQLKIFEQTKRKDAEIRYYNKTKNIPSELGDTDCLFYDLDKNVDAYIIEGLMKSVRKANKEEPTGNNRELAMDLPPLDDIDVGDLDLPDLNLREASDNLPELNLREENQLLTETNMNLNEADDLEIPDIESLSLTKK